MKRLVGRVVVAGLLSQLSSPAHAAVTLSFAQMSQQTYLGSPVTVALVIAGLGAQTPPSLGTFDLNVAFDPTILAFNSAVFGDPVLGDQLDLAGFGSIASATSQDVSLNLFEVSLDSVADLDSLQAATFTLATVSFDGVGSGMSELTIAINALGDAQGVPLSAIIGPPSAVTVNAIPEPSGLFLFGVGILSILVISRKTTR